MNNGAPWGKFSDGASHHLAHHCADVAACFEALASLPTVRARLERALLVAELAGRFEARQDDPYKKAD